MENLRLNCLLMPRRTDREGCSREAEVGWESPDDGSQLIYLGRGRSNFIQWLCVYGSKSTLELLEEKSCGYYRVNYGII